LIGCHLVKIKIFSPKLNSINQVEITNSFIGANERQLCVVAWVSALCFNFLLLFVFVLSHTTITETGNYRMLYVKATFYYFFIFQIVHYQFLYVFWFHEFIIIFRFIKSFWNIFRVKFSISVILKFNRFFVWFFSWFSIFLLFKLLTLLVFSLLSWHKSKQKVKNFELFSWTPLKTIK
jgi:hypothetical protein